MRLLVVDDDLMSRNFLHQLFDGPDIIIDCAPDCVTARKFIYSTSYDVITLDLSLPDGSGFDILEELRKYRSFSGKVVIISAEADKRENINRAIELQADTMFLKPFNCYNLRKEVLGLPQALFLPDPAMIVCKEEQL